MMWYVVVDEWCSNPEPEDRVWTVSRDPKETGWNTDSGYEGYGLTKADAEELANAANEIERLREALKFYADKQNYIEVKDSTVFVPIITVDFKPEIDNGRTARFALQQKEIDMDIVERLRGLTEEWWECCGNIHEPLAEAADEIERLREACYDLIKQGRNVLHMDGYVGLLKVETHNKFYILMNEIEYALQQKESE